jgi:hypothetical protein
MVAGDINNDNSFEIIAIDESGILYVWKKDGTEYRDGDSNGSTQGVFVPQLAGCTLNYSTPALADIDNDGKDEIIVGTQGDQLFAFNEDGSNVSGFPVALSNDISGSPRGGRRRRRPAGHRRCHPRQHGAGDSWQQRNHVVDARPVAHPHESEFLRASAAIGDVNADGKLETFIPTYDGKLYGLTYNTGANLAGFPTTYSTVTYTESSPIIADIDGDGSARHPDRQ